MLANWSLVLNVLLLIGVVIAIGRLMKARRKEYNPPSRERRPQLKTKEESNFFDDIIAVRRVSDEVPAPVDAQYVDNRQKPQAAAPIKKVPMDEQNIENFEAKNLCQPLMMFLQAKENRQLAGYELLQTLLAAGLRFGEGHLFHRHQFSNGQGPVVCSLASATATGVFDMQNIGAFSVRGLCLFMHRSGNESIDAERFKIMLETAKQLRDDLDTHLLDFQQRTFNEDSVTRYCHLLNITAFECAV